MIITKSIYNNNAVIINNNNNSNSKNLFYSGMCPQNRSSSLA